MNTEKRTDTQVGGFQIDFNLFTVNVFFCSVLRHLKCLKSEQKCLDFIHSQCLKSELFGNQTVIDTEIQFIYILKNKLYKHVIQPIICVRSLLKLVKYSECPKSGLVQISDNQVQFSSRTLLWSQLSEIQTLA